MLENMAEEIFFQYFTVYSLLRYTYSIKSDMSVSPMKLSHGGGFRSDFFVCHDRNEYIKILHICNWWIDVKQEHWDFISQKPAAGSEPQ